MGRGSGWTTLLLGDEDVRTSAACAADGCVITRRDFLEPGNDSTYVYKRADSSLQLFTGDGDVGAFSCVSVQFCLGVTGDNQAMRFNGTEWSPADMAGSGIPKVSLSCAATTLCVSVGSHSESTWNGTSWSAPQQIVGSRPDTFSGLWDVSCRPNICAAVDSGGWTVVAT